MCFLRLQFLTCTQSVHLQSAQTPILLSSRTSMLIKKKKHRMGACGACTGQGTGCRQQHSSSQLTAALTSKELTKATVTPVTLLQSPCWAPLSTQAFYHLLAEQISLIHFLPLLASLQLFTRPLQVVSQCLIVHTTSCII